MEITPAQYKRRLKLTKVDGPNPYVNYEFKNLTEKDKAYIAGIIDGEGCIRLNEYGKKKNLNNFVACVSITNVCPELIIYLINKIELGTIRLEVRNREKRRTIYGYAIFGNMCLRLLHVLYDFIFIKKDQVNVLFEFEKLSPGRRRQKQTPELVTARRELFEKLKALHHIEYPISNDVRFLKNNKKTNE